MPEAVIEGATVPIEDVVLDQGTSMFNSNTMDSFISIWIYLSRFILSYIEDFKFKILNYWNYKFMEIYEMYRAKLILIKL